MAVNPTIIARIVATSTAAQGIPERLSDELTARRVAVLLEVLVERHRIEVA